MYSETVMDHFKNPRNVGEIENPDGVGEVGNPVCGDIMQIFLKIENNVVVDAKFKTFGCGAAIASSSMVLHIVTPSARMEEVTSYTSSYGGPTVRFDLNTTYHARPAHDLPGLPERSLS